MLGRRQNFIVCLIIAITVHSALLSSVAVAQTFKGAAVAWDGDDLVVAGQRVRLHGIDGFELPQTCERPGGTWACGEEAKRVLNSLVAGKEVVCTSAQARPSHNRPVVRC
jgi:endonuclease YncB( thermonuclease family)